MELVACILPSLVGFGWFAMLTARNNKTLAMHSMSFLALFGGLYFLLDAITMVASHDLDTETIVYAVLANTFAGPLLPLAAIVFFITQIKIEQHTSFRWALVILPCVCYSFVAFLATKGLGFEKATDYIAHNHMIPGGLLEDERIVYKTFEFVVFDIYRYIMLFGFVAVICTTLYFFAVSDFRLKIVARFFFKGGPMKPSHLVAVSFLLLMATSIFRYTESGTQFMQDIGNAGIIYTYKAFCITAIGIFGYNSQKPAIYLVNKHNTPRFDDLPTLTPKTQWREESGEDEYSLPALHHHFHELMRDKQCYRRPGLNIYSVASELGVTVNSLNHMVKAVYGVNYNTYVKVQRVEFARRYHKAFPQLPPETVAMESGFRSANIMRQNFKEASYVLRAK